MNSIIEGLRDLLAQFKAQEKTETKAPPREFLTAIQTEPREPSPEYVAPLVIKAGFVNGRPGYIIYENGKEVRREPAHRGNAARFDPAGFQRSLARLMHGPRQ
jgi:hypothetical protein